LFDSQPERLEAFQCQGFVGKPIIESELLNTLEQILKLEWVRDNTPLSLTNPAPPKGEEVAVPEPTTLPEDMREELTRLTRQGQSTALRTYLNRARAEYPQYTVTLQFLQVLAERFDFETLAEHLREPDDD
jgi:hypothetical protein